MNQKWQRKIRIVFFGICFAVITLFIFKYSRIPMEKVSKQLVDGTIDLKEYDFINKTVQLDGDWNFYYGATLFSENFKVPNTPPPKEVKLESWKKMGYSDLGVGTYRILIKKDPQIKELAIKMSSVNSNYKLYINGSLVNGIGDPYLDGRPENIHVLNDYHFFTAQEENVEVIVHVNNTDYYAGGILEAPILGTQRNIQVIKDVNIAISIFLISCLVGIAAILFSFYLAKNEENSMFYLGIAAIFYAIKITLSTSGPFYFIYYSIPFDLLIRFFTMCTMMTIYFIFKYFYKSFEQKNDKFAFFVETVLQLYIVVVMFAKLKYFDIVNIVGAVLISLVYMYVFIKASRDLFKYRKTALLNFGGALILMISFSLDIDNMDTSKYRVLGLTVFCVLVLIDIIKDYLATYNNLKLIKNNLEHEVEVRSIEIYNINRNLQNEVKARRKAEENLKTISNFDLETGLFTKIYAKNYLDDLISVYYRHNHVFSIIIWRIDDLESIGKTLGITAVSKATSETLNIVKSLLRRTDLLANWEDDKYIIIMPNCSKNNAKIASEKVRSSISANIIEGIGIVTVSLGIASVEENDTVMTISNRGEEHLLRAEEKGKDTFYKNLN